MDRLKQANHTDALYYVRESELRTGRGKPTIRSKKLKTRELERAR